MSATSTPRHVSCAPSSSHAERVFGADSNLVGGLANLAVPAEMERGELDAAIPLARRSVDIYLKESQPETRAACLPRALPGADADRRAPRRSAA